jgi:citrate lyase subunit beta / citryl-CoA lyase
MREQLQVTLRVAVLVMGTNDLSQRTSRRAGTWSCTTCSLVCIWPCLPLVKPTKSILDGVYNDIKNAEGFTTECEQGQNMGFDGKTLIHPDQVAIANDTVGT